MKKLIKEYIDDEIKTLNNLNVDSIAKVIDILLDCLEHNKIIYVFGNGGSGSTASHIQNDLNKALFEKTDKKFNVVCLNDNIPIVLAIANDIGYEEIFRYQLDGKLKQDDVVIAISGSGNSKNIISAVKYAKKVGASVIGFTGYDGGKLKKLADISLDTNINSMEITEDIHLCLEHLMISNLYKTLGKREYINE